MNTEEKTTNTPGKYILFVLTTTTNGAAAGAVQQRCIV